MFKVPEEYRDNNVHPMLQSSTAHGNNGCFKAFFEGRDLLIIASDGEGWEHVSVSLGNRTPNWKEMCFVKGLFWGDEDTVVQYHPPKSQYVNNHEHCLHLWRPKRGVIPTPPFQLVGVK